MPCATFSYTTPSAKAHHQDLHFKDFAKSVQNSLNCSILIIHNSNSPCNHIAMMSKTSTNHSCASFVKNAKWPLTRVSVAHSSKWPNDFMDALPSSYTSFSSTVPSSNSQRTYVKSSWKVWSALAVSEMHVFAHLKLQVMNHVHQHDANITKNQAMKNFQQKH